MEFWARLIWPISIKGQSSYCYYSEPRMCCTFHGKLPIPWSHVNWCQYMLTLLPDNYETIANPTHEIAPFSYITLLKLQHILSYRAWCQTYWKGLLQSLICYHDDLNLGKPHKSKKYSLTLPLAKGSIVTILPQASVKHMAQLQSYNNFKFIQCDIWKKW